MKVSNPGYRGTHCHMVRKSAWWCVGDVLVMCCRHDAPSYSMHTNGWLIILAANVWQVLIHHSLSSSPPPPSPNSDYPAPPKLIFIRITKPEYSSWNLTLNHLCECIHILCGYSVNCYNKNKSEVPIASGISCEVNEEQTGNNPTIISTLLSGSVTDNSVWKVILPTTNNQVILHYRNPCWIGHFWFDWLENVKICQNDKALSHNWGILCENCTEIKGLMVL